MTINETHSYLQPLMNYHHFIEYFGPIVFQRFQQYLTSMNFEQVCHLKPIISVRFKLVEDLPRSVLSQPYVKKLKVETRGKTRKRRRKKSSKINETVTVKTNPKTKKYMRKPNTEVVAREYTVVEEYDEILEEVTEYDILSTLIEPMVESELYIPVAGIEFNSDCAEVIPNVVESKCECDQELKANYEGLQKEFEINETKLTNLTRDYSALQSFHSKVVADMTLKINHLDRSIRFFKLRMALIVSKTKFITPKGFDRMIHEKINEEIKEEIQEDPYQEF